MLGCPIKLLTELVSWVGSFPVGCTCWGTGRWLKAWARFVLFLLSEELIALWYLFTRWMCLYV